MKNLIFLLTLLIPQSLVWAVEFRCDMRYTTPEEKTDFLFLNEGIFLLREDGVTQVIYDKNIVCRSAFSLDRSEYSLVHEFKQVDSQTSKFKFHGESRAEKLGSNYKFILSSMHLAFNEETNRGVFFCSGSTGRTQVRAYLKNCSEI